MQRHQSLGELKYFFFQCDQKWRETREESLQKIFEESLQINHEYFVNKLTCLHITAAILITTVGYSCQNFLGIILFYEEYPKFLRNYSILRGSTKISQKIFHFTRIYENFLEIISFDEDVDEWLEIVYFQTAFLSELLPSYTCLPYRQIIDIFIHACQNVIYT